jgi:hypothetical protein
LVHRWQGLGKVRIVLIITGMGRSGTSLMAQFCRLLGFDPGGYMESGDVESINAGMEYPALTCLNAEIEQHMRRHGWVAASDFAARIEGIDRVVVKDPQLLGPWGWGGKLLEVWWMCRQDLKLLVLTREAHEVVQSWHAHASWFKAHLSVPRVSARDLRFARTVEERRTEIPLDELAGRVQQTATDFLAIANQLGVPVQQLRFPDFLNQFDLVYDHLVHFAGLNVQRSAALGAWNSLVDPKKVRQSKFPQPTMPRLAA